MIRTLFLLALLPAALPAQLRIYVAPPNAEIPAPAVYDMGSTAAGDALDTRFRVRNHGSGAAVITTLKPDGVGFSVLGQPSLPYTIAPGLNLDFTVRFRALNYGSYSANLVVNGVSVLLHANASAAAVIRANGEPLIAGSTVDFGRIERGGAVATAFELSNVTPQSVAVSVVQITGDGFVAANLPGALELAAGATVPFTVRFEPKAAGVFTGKLSIDGREIRLTGAATEPPFTRPVVVIESFAAESAQQGRVSVRFASASRASGTGKLSISFQPAAATDNDAGILFPSSGSRTVPLSVREGDLMARFGDAGGVVFQTGTTAGTINLVAEIGGYTEQTSISIGAAAVKFDETSAARTGNSIELRLTGFDNTQSVGDISFTFYDRQGNIVQPGAFRVNARDDFKRYFDSSKLGGTFGLRATFPVAGDAAQIQAVEVEFANSAGSTRTPRLRF